MPLRMLNEVDVIGNRISALLGERRENISEFARNLGISYSTANDLYHGKTKMITFDLMDKLCKYFGTGTEGIFPFKEDTPQTK